MTKSDFDDGGLKKALGNLPEQMIQNIEIQCEGCQAEFAAKPGKNICPKCGAEITVNVK